MRVLKIPKLAHIDGLWTSFARSIDKNFVFHGEVHDFYELVILLDGELSFTAGASTFFMEAPAAVLYPPMTFHNLHSISEEEASVLFLGFDASAVPSYKNLYFSITENDIKRANRILALTHATIENHQNKKQISQEEARAVAEGCKELEILLLSLCDRDTVKKKDRSAGALNYERALQTIEENLSMPLDTNTLARMVHISPALLKKTFSCYAGMGVMQYVRKRKINAAILRLRAGERVKEVASSLGFPDASYFSTVFRRITGHTPTHYRK